MLGRVHFKNPSVILLGLIYIFVLGCELGRSPQFKSDFLIQGSDLKTRSSTAGNLVTTALKEVHQLDIVLYPSELLSPVESTLAWPGMSAEDMEVLLGLFPDGTQDSFIIGHMRGRDIKSLVHQRSRIRYQVDLEVAGIEYHVHFVGGMPQHSSVQREWGQPLEDRQMYRVAINEFFYFSSATFPGYRYGNGLGFTFSEVQRGISARQALRQYLEQGREFPDLTKARAQVTTSDRGDVGVKTIREIRGAQHRSPLYGQRVTTEGIVTARGHVEWYPGGIDVYIQEPGAQERPDVSQGMHLHVRDENVSLVIGDHIRVTGVVYEQVMNGGLGRTSMREIEKLEVLSRNNSLPPAVPLGKGGREIPDGPISTYRGNLNLKPYLDLKDGIDFWESLEGMRVRIHNPRVVSFQGGQQDFESLSPKGYLTIYVVADGDEPHERRTPNGGVVIDESRHLFNPQIIRITTNHLSYPLDTSRYLQVGDMIPGTLEGVLGYEPNLFGDGEYVLILPEACLRDEMGRLQNSCSAPMDKYLKSKPEELPDLKACPESPDIENCPEPPDIENYLDSTNPKIRPFPQSRFYPEDDKLTVATFNLENLAGYQLRRIKRFGEALRVNLKCPDIVVLVEVQDYNGVDYFGDASADLTLRRLIQWTPCPGVDYDYLNIDPLLHNEGGQPGGNIRVATLYNRSKLKFVPRPVEGPLVETTIRRDGTLSANPGRLFVKDEEFDRTRRSLVAEFEFKGERVVVVGNHLNSKLGDSSHWGAEQPVVPASDRSRTIMTTKLNHFVRQLIHLDPKVNVVMIGDFNAFIGDMSMQVLESGGVLTNLMSHTLPLNQRYTTNHDGSSQVLDHILVSPRLMEKKPEFEVLHMNSDFMGRLSDHDPILSRFDFGQQSN